MYWEVVKLLDGLKLKVDLKYKSHDALHACFKLTFKPCWKVYL